MIGAVLPVKSIIPPPPPMFRAHPGTGGSEGRRRSAGKAAELQLDARDFSATGGAGKQRGKLRFGGFARIALAVVHRARLDQADIAYAGPRSLFATRPKRCARKRFPAQNANSSGWEESKFRP